jgi:hypothetical protein
VTDTWTPTNSPTITYTPTITFTHTETSTPTTTPTPNAALYLDHNYFNPEISPLGMDIRVDTPGEVKVIVYNIAGEEVRKVMDEYKGTGNYRAFWDGRNTMGDMAGNAVYFILIQQPSVHLVRKVVVLK